MKWTDCLNPNECDKCLEVMFMSGKKDTACLNQVYPENGCVFRGNFLKKDTPVAVSSSKCFCSGHLDDIQVKISHY